MINTPSLLRWAINAYKSKKGRKAIVRIFTEGFGLTAKCVEDLLSGKITHKIEGENVIFEGETETVKV